MSQPLVVGDCEEGEQELQTTVPKEKSIHYLVSFIKAVPGAGVEVDKAHRTVFRARVKESWRSLLSFVLNKTKRSFLRIEAVSGSFVVVVLAVLCGMQDLSVPTRGQTCAPLQWTRGALTTGPPGNSSGSTFVFPLGTQQTIIWWTL